MSSAPLRHPRLHLRYALGTFVSEVPAVIMADKGNANQFNPLSPRKKPCGDILIARPAFTGSHARYFWLRVLQNQNKL